MGLDEGCLQISRVVEAVAAAEQAENVCVCMEGEDAIGRRLR